MSGNKKILITGSNGLLGQSLTEIMADTYDLFGCDLTKESFHTDPHLKDYFQVNLTHRDEVQKLMAKIRPDIIINTAAYSDVDQCETKHDFCWDVNVRSVELLLENAADSPPIFIQISSDYIFDGKSGPYRENDPPNPLSYYGHTKLEAEKILRSSGFEYIIARTMLLFGSGRNVRKNFATWVIQELNSGNKIKVVDDQVGNATFVNDLSTALLKLLESEHYGIYHIAGDEICSRYELAQKIAKTFQLDQTLIKQVSTKDLHQKAARPANSSFVLDKLSNTLDWLPGKLTESLSQFKAQLENNNG